METYNGVFRLLLKLRRVQVKLSDTWKSVWRWRNNRLLQLRWSVQHVLLHLGHYVHNDVIEVQKSIMDQRIVDCRDFDRFRMAHAQFLAVVAAQTFLHVPAVSRTSYTRNTDHNFLFIKKISFLFSEINKIDEKTYIKNIFIKNI